MKHLKHINNIKNVRTGALYIRLLHTGYFTIHKVMSKPKWKTGWNCKIWKIDIMSFPTITEFDTYIEEWYVSDFGVNKDVSARIYSFSHKTLNKLKNLSEREIANIFKQPK